LAGVLSTITFSPLNHSGNNNRDDRDNCWVISNNAIPAGGRKAEKLPISRT
jgi:hypothetical protein